VITHVRRALGQGGSLIAADERSRIETALADLERARAGEDRDLIRDKTTELNRITEHLAELMMDAALRGALESRRAEDL
jgi:predicted methyltransferase MtxX (methanogen marker protein 4)